jgi:uncharacterized peroxidase-related enzyme
MTTIPQIESGSATPAQAAALEAIKKAYGSVPNLGKVLANSPAAVNGWLAFSGALTEGVLPAPVRELLAVGTAVDNRCTYCLSAHTYLAEKVSRVDPSEVVAARTNSNTDPHIDALLKLSHAIGTSRGAVAPADIDQARAAGVTEAEIIEIIANLALNIMTNYVNIVADTDIDWPVVDLVGSH